MATTDNLPEQQDRQGQRRRPFSTWVKKLTNFKNSDGERPRRHKKKRAGKANNPYPESGAVGGNANGVNEPSTHSVTTGQTNSNLSGEQSVRTSDDVNDLAAPPVINGDGDGSTGDSDREYTGSVKAPSHGESSVAGTNPTMGGGLDSRRGGDSTFSSPAPSVRSLTTTLTTIQSLAPTTQTATAQNQGNTQSIQFSQPFPSASPASAIPSHLTPTANPTTYNTATANNLLTDNASILTLASSSKRRRRRSMDTDASVRALAPSSVWGGSRESLPLSVLSANIDTSNLSSNPGIHNSSTRLGAERNSLYSSTGVGPALAGERSSAYAKQGDGASVRSGRLGHGRTDSVGGSNANVSSTLVSPREDPDEKHEPSRKVETSEKDDDSAKTTKEE